MVLSEQHLAAGASVNGSSDVGAAPVSSDLIPRTGPRIPKRLVEVDVPEYPGFRATLWVNYPQRLVGEMQSGDGDRMADALCQIVVAHNGWLDDTGEPLPPPSTRAFWDEVPTELAAVLLVLVNAEASRLPNSLAPTRPRSSGR